MQDYYLEIADFVICLTFEQTEAPYYIENAFKEKIIWFYAGFLLRDKPQKIDHRIRFVFRNNFPSLIQKHAKKTYVEMYESISENETKSFYYISDTQINIMLRTIVQNLLARHGGVLFHASACKIGDKAVLFLGKSGAGKSTAMRMTSNLFPSLADDIVILRKKNGKHVFYQTPFIEKNTLSAKISRHLPLYALCFVKKSLEHKLEKIEKKEKIIKAFMEQVFTEKIDMKKQLAYTMSLINEVDSFYTLSFSLQNGRKMVQLLEDIHSV